MEPEAVRCEGGMKVLRPGFSLLVLANLGVKILPRFCEILMQDPVESGFDPFSH